MIQQLEVLLMKLDELEFLLEECVSVTNTMVGADLEIVEQTNVILDKRGELIEQMQHLMPQIFDIVEEEEQKDLIFKMLQGENIYGDFPADLQTVYSKILNIRSLKEELLEMDKINDRRIKNKIEDVKTVLAGLKEDKKKIDYYNKASFGGKGSQLNSNA